VCRFIECAAGVVDLVWISSAPKISLVVALDLEESQHDEEIENELEKAGGD